MLKKISNFFKKTKNRFVVNERLGKIYDKLPVCGCMFNTKLGYRRVVCCKFCQTVILTYYDKDDTVLFTIESKPKSYKIKNKKSTIDELSAFLAIYELEQILGIGTHNITMLDLMSIAGKTRLY